MRGITAIVLAGLLIVTGPLTAPLFAMDLTMPLRAPPLVQGGSGGGDPPGEDPPPRRRGAGAGGGGQGAGAGGGGQGAGAGAGGQGAGAGAGVGAEFGVAPLEFGVAPLITALALAGIIGGIVVATTQHAAASPSIPFSPGANTHNGLP